jgi:hypothetical protein
MGDPTDWQHHQADVMRRRRPFRAHNVRPCPLELGELEIWLLRSGRLALVCDECDATWLDPNAVSGDSPQYPSADPPVTVPSRPASLRVRVMARLRLIVPTRNRSVFVLLDGDVLVRPALADEIRAGGWGDLIAPAN